MSSGAKALSVLTCPCPRVRSLAPGVRLAYSAPARRPSAGARRELLMDQFDASPFGPSEMASHDAPHVATGGEFRLEPDLAARLQHVMGMQLQQSGGDARAAKRVLGRISDFTTKALARSDPRDYPRRLPTRLPGGYPLSARKPDQHGAMRLLCVRDIDASALSSSGRSGASSTPGGWCSRRN